MMRLSNRFPSRWTLILLIGAALVLFCYAYIDAPLARWAHQHQLRQYGIFHGLQALADGLLLLALLAVAYSAFPSGHAVVAAVVATVV